MARMLLFGGGGQIGTAIREASEPGVSAPSHAEFDIVDGDIEELLTRQRPDVVVNCAAFHNVDRCERDPWSALRANAAAVDRMAAACDRNEIVFLTFSSDYVFAGDADRPYRETDAPNPRTAYGVSKFAGELLALRYPTTIVVRTSGVFGTTGTSSKGQTLIDKVLAQADRGETTRMVSDVVFSPSYAPHVARAVLALLEKRSTGLHHVVNAGNCSWYDYVRTAFEKTGVAPALLEPISYASLESVANRPAYSAMINTTFADLEIEPLPAWQSALDEYLAVRAHRMARSGASGLAS